ncbi:MAG: class I SAM-dependent methyltransferase [Candidatus Rokuibacteriota bacterium]
MSEAQARRVQEQFGASAAAYVTSAAHAAGDDLETLLAWGRACRPARVLDVATGGGHTALAFAAIAARVVAVDMTEPMLRVARDFIRGRGATNVEFAAGDVEALPFRDGAFDVVTCRIAPHHFADVAAAVRQVHRVLKRGGSFLVQDILGHDEPDTNAFITEVEKRRDPSHVRAYRAAEWKAFLRAAGLTIMDDASLPKIRVWDDWTGRMRMSAEARRDLEAFVRAAPERCRAAFDFKVSGNAVESFTDRMILLRAERD